MELPFQDPPSRSTIDAKASLQSGGYINAPSRVGGGNDENLRGPDRGQPGIERRFPIEWR
jgi:hypothetical protein